MRRAVIALAILVTPAVPAQQPTAKTIDVAKKQALREGSLQYRVLSLEPSKSPLGDFVNITVEIRNISEKEEVKRDVWHERLKERQLSDDNGKQYKISSTTLLSGVQESLQPKGVEVHRITFYCKLTAKQNFLYLTLPKSATHEEVRFAMPARAFKAR